jgi:HlyD family secretion protein
MEEFLKKYMINFLMSRGKPVTQRSRLLLAFAVIGIFAYFKGQFGGNEPRAEHSRQNPSVAHRLVVAPGIVEPAGKEREISSQVVGVIEEFKIGEGEPVEAGQLIAVIENSEQRARVMSAEAQLSLRQAQLDQLLHGTREEEVRAATAALDEAEATMKFAERDFQRRLPLFKHGFTPQAVLDQLKANLDSSKARRAAASERLTQLKNGARPEELEVARANVKLARAEVEAANAALAKTYVRSPVTGILLSRAREVGETVTNIPPTTLAIIGDLRGLRVRADVDETDVAKVADGQRVEISSDAFPGKVFYGKVTRISTRMGPKGVTTGRPDERIDTKVLQALVTLDEGVKLPIGLRVDVHFYSD